MVPFFKSIPSISNSTDITSKRSNRQRAFTTFSDGDGPVITVYYKRGGRAGIGSVGCLYKITERKYRFRFYTKEQVRIKTLTQTDDVAPYDVIKELVASINGNATFKKYIHVVFHKESTSAFSTNVDFANGQTFRG